MEWNVGPSPIFPFRHDPQFPPFERFLQRLPKFQRLRLSDLLYSRFFPALQCQLQWRIMSQTSKRGSLSHPCIYSEPSSLFTGWPETHRRGAWPARSGDRRGPHRVLHVGRVGHSRSARHPQRQVCNNIFWYCNWGYCLMLLRPAPFQVLHMLRRALPRYYFQRYDAA